MPDMAINRGIAEFPSPRPHPDGTPHIGGAVAFLLGLAAALGHAPQPLDRCSAG